MYNKILAPLDGSKLSECSLEHIKEVAGGCHVKEVILLMVLESPQPITFEYASQSRINEMYQQQRDEQQKVKETAEKYLAGTREYLQGQGIAVQSVVIQAEANQSVAELILNYTESNNIDLVVMSTHGRSGITRWAFGSVADRVVRYSMTPVLTITPSGCRLRTG